MYRILSTAVLLFISLSLSFAQEKKPLGHQELVDWKNISEKIISNNGRWVTYQVEAEEGNPTTYLYQADQDKTLSFERARNPEFTADNRFLLFSLQPDVMAQKALRRQGEEVESVDTLAIYHLTEGRFTKVAHAKKIQVPEKWSGWVFFTLEQEEEERTDLIAHQLATGDQVILEAVDDFTLAEERAAASAISKGTDQRNAGVYRLNPEEKTWQAIHQQKGEYAQLRMDGQGQKIAFLADFDTLEQRIDYFDLYHWSTGSAAVRKIADRVDAFLPEGWLISKHGRLNFSRNGQRLTFGIAPEPILEDTTMLAEEKVNVEVWSYQDEILYTRQELQADREKERTYTCVWLADQEEILPLESPELPDAELSDEGNGRYAMVYTESPYQKSSSWDGGPSGRDVYLVDLQNGQRSLVEKNLQGYPNFSPNGQFLYWYSYPDTAWYALSVTKKEKVQLTNNEMVPFYDELNDRPMLPGSYGLAGWTEDDDFLLLYDRYDVWLVDPSEELASNNLTNGRDERRVSRLVRIDPEARAIEEVEPMLFHFTDEETRRSGYYWFNIHTGTKKMVQEGDFAYERRPQKAKDADSWIFTKENYQTFPDIQYAPKGLAEARKISQVNPQQENYKWGSIELYSWTSATGEKLEGLLVKPEGFDPNKKYPMIVNFYERSSQGLHRHRTPEPNRSTINYPFYASRDYLIFNPDVPYRIGYPGESAYNAVLSGVTALIDEGFVDKDNIGLQGHSWGGYQIAHIITKTDLFKCAESGAPVVNMFSAYGGIRWGSGRSRMFQYERTQSRIGGTIWDKPLRYLENSPIFFLDKINTPVLILHNDKDTAVPWYQGIEFFVGMRRLGKPAWLLNYNDEPHWPLKLQNRKDFQLRMSQFFDYYLQGASMPLWMAEGVPATEKGINQRLELMDRH
ncbi:MAG TPA: prolyl oligopeptidase family serine peptidase [Saprospiraceae bacterium]|nr:prolyl oligopeptidase family serine peptidase [Saprospiraceae bacterium]